MPLSKKDLKKIKDVVDTGNKSIGARIDNLESYIRRRFDDVDIRFNKIDRKIDQLIKTENEDIQVAFKEIKALKSRLKKLESRVRPTQLN